MQQLREAITQDRHRHLIHDRDRIFSKHLDDSIGALGVEVLRSRVASPKANAVCEPVIGTIRRECLDWMIPLSEAHLWAILKEWVTQHNSGHPHSVLGPACRTRQSRPRCFRSPNPAIGLRRALCTGEIGVGRPASRVLPRDRVILRREKDGEIYAARVIAEDKTLGLASGNQHAFLAATLHPDWQFAPSMCEIALRDARRYSE